MSLLTPDAPIGVFDSGIGGLSVLRALQRLLPVEDFVYLADSGFAPYGERGDDHVVARTVHVAETLRNRHRIKALVVACNTATAAAIHLLRATHSDLHLVGVEPAVKPALAVTRTGRIAVLGTRGTVTSAKFKALMAPLQHQAHFSVQPCDGLATAIEDELLQPGSADSNAINTIALCRLYTSAAGTFGLRMSDIDTLVLGCTHYVFAAPALRELVGPQIRLIDTGEPVARQTQRLLARHGLLRAESGGPGRLELVSTGDLGLLQAAAGRWLGVGASQGADATAP
ncbi:glutamate racemase [Xylophilus ampelinus]|uniref:Glutamate racemase n=1 Tax=Xylophilus ampelinus TaxID=54067 RepID=A0A318SZH7_9BURK|nr:glutamate racemase [Xylophilus ampelinus]MCS4509929.1 glutamate racemase [Xylophilus ampelinus]PYE78518.1 glutamate racemase [Xylophilus ampelinus]